MEDILEEIVGDIYDEYDEIEEEYEKLMNKTFILSGSMPIYDVNKLLDSHIPEGDYDTTGYLSRRTWKNSRRRRDAFNRNRRINL